MTQKISLRIDAYDMAKARASVFLDGRDGLTEWDREWFDSEALLAFTESINDYDESRGMNIVSFLEFRIDGRLKNSVRKESSTVGIIPSVTVRSVEDRINGRIGMKEIMKALEPRDRKVFYLYFIEDRSMDEVGKVLNISGSRVRQLINGRIKKKVREILGDEGN